MRDSLEEIVCRFAEVSSHFVSTPLDSPNQSVPLSGYKRYDLVNGIST